MATEFHNIPGTKLKHVQINDNGTTYYESGMQKWSKDEIEEMNKKFFESCEEYVQMALDDGFIEFPIMYEEGPDKILWSKCWLPPTFVPSGSEGFKEKYGFDFNIYIPSYKRAGFAATGPLLDTYGITNYYYCVDPDQYPIYKAEYGPEKVIIRDPTFKNDEKLYQVLSTNVAYNLAGGASFINAILYMAKALGEDKYFIADDDIYGIGLKAPKSKFGIVPGGVKYYKDNFLRCSNLTPELGFDLKDYLTDMEKVFDLGRNRCAIATEKYGLVYNVPINHIRYGTRSYTFYLSDTHMTADHEGLLNNDISTSLRNGQRGLVNMLLEGYQYNSWDTQPRITKKDANTGELKVLDGGGCTDSYRSFGTLDKAKCLVQAHPNFNKITFLFNRIHHVSDFSQYTNQRLVGAPVDGNRNW